MVDDHDRKMTWTYTFYETAIIISTYIDSHNIILNLRNQIKNKK